MATAHDQEDRTVQIIDVPGILLRIFECPRIGDFISTLRGNNIQ